MIGFIDYIITADLGFSIFYVLPIALLTWYWHPKVGYLASVASTILWLIAKQNTAFASDNPFLMLWNASVRLAFFVLLVLLLGELKTAYQIEQTLAQTDDLTGLLNRRAFLNVLDKEIERSRRHTLVLTVAYLDVDNFKQVNDQLGHAAGDRLLQAIAHVLTHQVRTIDYATRLGGDEFALLMPQTNRDQAQPVLRRVFTQLTALQAHYPAISFSMGAVTFVTLPPSADKALSTADKLMYQVKAQGKDRWVQALYQPSLDPAEVNSSTPRP
ncbi:MAG TPA: GGDEF domain-containing protein [Candidatus Obscuribacterales bacterium]